MQGDIICKSNKDEKMGEIVHNIDWTIYKEWYSSCKPLLEANKRSQRTSIPNLHHVLLDTMLILDDLVKLSNSVEVVDDIRNWARQMIRVIAIKR